MVSKRLKELREEKKLSKLALAKLSGLSATAIANYEQGVRVPTEENLQKLCKALGVATDRFADVLDKESKPAEKSVETKTAPAAEKKAAPAAEKKAAPAAEKKAAPVVEKKEAPKAKKAAASNAEKKAVESKPIQIVVESQAGGSVTVEEIIARVKAAAPEATNIYVKAEENKAYWTSEKMAGDVSLWD